MIEPVEETKLFDYAIFDSETRVLVQEKARRIHAHLKRTAEDIIAIGLDLIEVKSSLCGLFENWLRTEFDMSQRSAERFMQVAARFEGRPVAKMATTVSVLYEFLNLDERILEKIETGQISATLPAIREAKREMQEEDSVEHLEETEETHYQTAVDMGTTEYYYADLRRESFKRDEEERTEKQRTQNKEQSDTATEIDTKVKSNSHVMRVMGSSESPEWYTPQEIIKCVMACFGKIDLDPCSNSHESPSVPARKRYTREDNGLAHPWTGKVYLNPPYGSEIPDWIRMLVASYVSGAVEEAIALIPARIDTQWFQPLYAYPMCHVRGRLQFSNAPHSAPFPNIIVYLGQNPNRFIDCFKKIGPIMGRIG